MAYSAPLKTGHGDPYGLCDRVRRLGGIFFWNREVHRKLSGSGGYAAGEQRRSQSRWDSLQKVMKNSGGEPGLEGGRDRGMESSGRYGLRNCGRCGLKQECLKQQDGRSTSLLSAPFFLRKKGALDTRICPGISGPVPEENGLSAGIK